MICTTAAIIFFLGYMPPRGTEIIIPRSKIVALSKKKQDKASACAQKYGIKYRIDESS